MELSKVEDLSKKILKIIDENKEVYGEELIFVVSVIVYSLIQGEGKYKFDDALTGIIKAIEENARLLGLGETSDKLG